MMRLLACALTIASSLQPPGQLQQPANPNTTNPNTTPAVGTATMRGHVFAADSGQPLRKAQVRITSGERRESRLATTDADGGYEFKEVKAGRYTIAASKGSYVDLSYGQQRPNDAPKPIAILDNQTVERLDFSLPRGGVLTGRIVDEFGEPMPDIQVATQQYQTFQGQRRLMPTGRQSWTNDLGEFRLFGVPPGQYYLVATWRSNNPQNDEDRTAYAAMYFPGTENAGQAQRVTVAAGGEVDDLVIAMKPLRATRISGTVVTSDGRPMTGMVMVMSTGGPGAAMSFTVSSAGPIRPDGTFSVSGLAPGEYTLRAQSNGMPSADSETAMAKITATGDDITDLRIVAAKPSTLTGRIVTDPAAASALPPTLQLMLSPMDPGTMPMGIVPTKMGDDGSFEMRSEPGRMRINLINAAGWSIRAVRLNGADLTDAGVEFRVAEDITGIDVELTNRLTVISGLVTNARGEAQKNYSAIAFSQDREKWKILGRYQSTGRPDQDGRFKISGLPPGDYYVIALDKIDPGQISDPEFLDAIRVKATSLNIREGETKTVDLKLQI